jgi:hypothetical protein
MRRAGCSNSGLASRVQAVAREYGADLKCTHVDVRRWLDGVIPRAAAAQYIAIALSRKAGTRIPVDEIGFGGQGTSAVLENGLDYPKTGPQPGSGSLVLPGGSWRGTLRR